MRALLDEGADVNAANSLGETALYLACDYSEKDSLRGVRQEVVQYLLKHGANVNKPDDKGSTPLMRACASHNLNLAKILLRSEAKPDYIDCNGNSALHLALLGHDSFTKAGILVDLLARHGCEVNHSNKGKLTPLMISASKGWNGVIQTLLLADCDLEKVDGESCTALCLAVQSKHPETVRLLLQNGANPSRPNYRRTTPLLFAVRAGDKATIDVLLSSPKGLSTIDTPNCEGITPLLLAVDEAIRPCNGLNTVAGSVVSALLDHGCDINCQHGSSGDTALILAAKAASIEFVRFLLDKGAAINLTDRCGETALSSSLDCTRPTNNSNHILKLLRLLVTAGADVNLCNQNGLTALHKAVHKGYPLNVVKYLLEAGTNLTSITRDANQYSLLQSAISSDSKDSALLLIDKGCDVNHQSAAGEMALTLAIRLDSHDVARRLMDCCDVNAGSRNSPLHIATYMGKEPLVMELLKRDADVTKKDSRGDTPVQVAIEGHHKRILNMLLSAGCCFQYHGHNTISPLALLRGSITPPDRQPLFLAVQHDDLELFKTLLSRYHRKPFQLLKTLHDMLTIDSDLAQRGNHMMSRQSRDSLLTLLRDELSMPQTLLELCRGELRLKFGGKSLKRRVHELSIPLSLKRYLLFDTDGHLDLSDLDYSPM
ncbi:putative ankyrin repeat protein RF_0381 [Watersipora subatra]|uniref:putative ankyrin repeat protein RF_0381 n=1 Tax=Watersipora subatra TaxID=2589382 RepID=UPI00355C3572